MEEKYTGKDVLKMAVQAKEKGINMYMALARNSENYHVAQLFAELAKDEQRHKLELNKWLEEAENTERDEAYPGDKAMFLRALVDDNTFKCDDIEKKALGMTIDEEDALRAGIDFEKDLMLFMHELRRHVMREDIEVIDKLIDEEARHIKDIINIRNKMSAE